MHTKVQETSINSYHSLQHKETQTDKILEYITLRGKATRGMIAKALKMEKSTVSARVHPLIHGAYKNGIMTDFPKLEEFEPEKEIARKCPVSGISVMWLKPLEDDSPQERLFD